MSGRCSSRPLATLTTCNGDLDADTHGVILSPAVPSPPPLPLSPPPNYTRERAVARRGPLSPPLHLQTPTTRYPSRLDVARFTHAPTHSSPRSRAARHAYAPACLCTSQPLTRPHLNLADSCGAVCAAACRSAVAAAASPLFYLSSLSHSPTAGLREFVGLWSYHRHVARISRGYDDRSVCSYQHVCNVGVVECESRPSTSVIAHRPHTTPHAAHTAHRVTRAADT